MITETELRKLLRYDDSHLDRVFGMEMTHKARQHRLQRRLRVGAAALALAAMAATVGYGVLERRPHIVTADIAYASGPTVTLPDGSIETFGGKARAWVDSRGHVCWGNDATSLCGVPSDEGQASFESPFATVSTAKSPDAILGGLVHEPLTRASFTTADGQEIPAVAIQFRKFPGWTVVVASIPRGNDGRIPDPEDLTFNSR